MGLVHKQPGSIGIQLLHKRIGVDYKGSFGDEDYEIPFPATILVDAKGIVRNAFPDANISKTLQPDNAFRWVDALSYYAGLWC